MQIRAMILGIFLLAAAALATVFVWRIADGSIKNSCAYGSGKSRSSCKARPEPSASELAAAVDGTALAAALEAFRRDPDGNKSVVGIGINRWGEVSFALPTGRTGFGVPRERFVRIGPGGQVLDENLQAQYEDASGSIAFEVDSARPEVLREALARADRPARFTRARLEPAFGNTGLAWQLTFVSRGQQDGQAAMYAAALDGSGLCRLNDASNTPGVPACNLAQLPRTPVSADARIAAPGLPSPATDPALAKAFAQMACVKKADGDVAALQRCVQ